MSTDLLRVDGLNTYYEQSHILQGVSLSVPEGRVVALLGRNGAGKTTTLKSIMGIVAPRSGQVLFAGRDLARQPTHRIARHGIAYVPEDRGIFPSLSVQEHLTLARPHRDAATMRTLDEVYALFPRLRERASVGGARLSGGEQQMLSIARALALNPRLLILDEPAEGLAPVVVQQILEALIELKNRGMTMLVVEQNYPFACALSDELYVLGKGRIRWQGTTDELESNPEMKHTWIGI